MGVVIMILSLACFLLLACFIAVLKKWADTESELTYALWKIRMYRAGKF